MNTRAWPLLACLAINLYLLGTACLLLAIASPLLAEVGAGLPAFHASLSRRSLGGTHSEISSFLELSVVEPSSFS